MLPRLRHDPFVRCHDHQRDVDSSGTGKHVLNEPLVARHVHDADLVARRHVEPGKAEVNRHSPALLFAEPVRIDAREALNERRLPMVDMTGGSNDFHAV